MQLTSAVIQELDDVLPYDSQRHVYDRLIDLFSRNGLYLIDDKEREMLGLEPRDDYGWTASERVKQKLAEQEAMQTLACMILEMQEAGQ